MDVLGLFRKKKTTQAVMQEKLDSLPTRQELQTIIDNVYKDKERREYWERLTPKEKKNVVYYIWEKQRRENIGRRK